MCGAHGRADGLALVFSPRRSRPGRAQLPRAHEVVGAPRGRTPALLGTRVALTRSWARATTYQEEHAKHRASGVRVRCACVCAHVCAVCALLLRAFRGESHVSPRVTLAVRCYV